MAKIWIATLDDLTCDYCAEMDGQVIRDDEDWEVAPGDVHPGCRCEELDLDLLAGALGLGFITAAIFDQGNGRPPTGIKTNTPSWEYEADYDEDVPDDVFVDGGTADNYGAYLIWD